MPTAMTGASQAASSREVRATEPTVQNRKRSSTAGERISRALVAAVQPAVTAAPASTRDSGPGAEPVPGPSREAAEATA